MVVASRTNGPHRGTSGTWPLRVQVGHTPGRTRPAGGVSEPGVQRDDAPRDRPNQSLQATGARYQRRTTGRVNDWRASA